MTNPTHPELTGWAIVPSQTKQNSPKEPKAVILMETQGLEKKDLRQIIEKWQSQNIACLLHNDDERAIHTGADGFFTLDIQTAQTLTRHRPAKMLVIAAGPTRHSAMEAGEMADAIVLDANIIEGESLLERASWWSGVMTIPLIIANADNKNEDALSKVCDFIARPL